MCLWVSKYREQAKVVTFISESQGISEKHQQKFFIMYFELIAYNIVRNKLIEFGTWTLHCLVKLCHFRAKQQKNSSTIFLRACYQLVTEWYWIHEFKLPKLPPPPNFSFFFFSYTYQHLSWIGDDRLTFFILLK